MTCCWAATTEGTVTAATMVALITMAEAIVTMAMAGGMAVALPGVAATACLLEVTTVEARVQMRVPSTAPVARRQTAAARDFVSNAAPR